MRFKSTFSGAVLALGACAAFTFCTRAAALPAEYTRLEYIQGTGTQWINTGYTPASNDTIEEEVEFTGVGQNQAFWCARTDGAKATFTFFWLTGGLRFDYNTKQTTIPLGTFTAATGTRYKVKADGTTGDVTITYDTANGTTNNTVLTYEPASFTVGGTLSVLASQMKGSTSPGNYGLYKFYSLAITKSDGTPAVNLVPAKRVSDGALGVYDTVRDVFKTNAGSGTFLGLPYAKARWTNAGEPRELDRDGRRGRDGGGRAPDRRYADRLLRELRRADHDQRHNQLRARHVRKQRDAHGELRLARARQQPEVHRRA